MLRAIHRNHRNFWTKDRLLSLLLALALFAIALIVQKAADTYLSGVRGVPVGDVLLSNIPPMDIDGFIILGTLTFTVLIVGLLASKPKYIVFTIQSLALFVIVRSFFISLTHLGVNPHEIQFDPNIIGFSLYDILYNSKNDFFFSGHTGIPFLMFLIFYRETLFRNLFLLVTLLFGISVIVGHIHYSIDVFSAPFITYGIYTIAKRAFPKEFAYVHSDG